MDGEGPVAELVPWRKNVLMLFAIGYFACAALYGADVYATSAIDGYATQAAVIVEAVKLLTVGVIAVAKDLIR